MQGGPGGVTPPPPPTVYGRSNTSLGWGLPWLCVDGLRHANTPQQQRTSKGWRAAVGGRRSGRLPTVCPTDVPMGHAGHTGLPQGTATAGRRSVPCGCLLLLDDAEGGEVGAQRLLQRARGMWRTAGATRGIRSTVVGRAPHRRRRAPRRRLMPHTAVEQPLLVCKGAVGGKIFLSNLC